MRRVVIVGLVVVVVMIVVWKLACHHGSGGPGGSGGTPPATGSAGSRTRIGKPAANPASLSGRVTRRVGNEPIAGAVVAIQSMAATAAPSTVVVTDGSGAWSAPAIAPGGYKVKVSAVGFLPASTDKLAIAAGERKDHVDLALAPGGTTVSGTVTDGGGGAVAGARVTLDRDSMLFTRGPNEHVVALTGDDGSYKLTLPDGDWNATVTHDDYTRDCKWLRVVVTPLVVDFVLVPGATLRGQVVAKDGTPVPGAEVSWYGERRRNWYGRATADADADGKFTLKGVDSGAISLFASARGHASRSRTTITVGVGEQVDNVKIVVDPAFSISGTVVDSATRKGIAGVYVQGTGYGMDAEPTGADGVFEITGVAPGSYQLSALGASVRQEWGKSFEVVDKDVTGIVIEIVTGVRLSGRVEPPVDTAISMAPDFGVTAGSDPITGAFVVKNVPAGEFSLIATHADGRTGRLAVTVAGQDQANLVITLEARASIAGKVIDASGAAVSGVRVAAEPVAQLGSNVVMPSCPGSRGSMEVFPDGSWLRNGMATGADGSFKIVGLAAGKFAMSVCDDHGSLAPARGDKLADVELSKGQDRTGLVLTIEVRDGKITGRVVGADGKPAADAWVTAMYQVDGGTSFEAEIARESGEIRPVLTTAEGRFVLEHLRRGSHQLVVDGARGMSRAEATAKVGDDVTITLAALGTLSGRVTVNGTPVATYDLDCRDPRSRDMFNGRFNQHISADDSSYAAERILPGTYDCLITSDRGTANDKIAIPNGPVQHDFALSAFASVTGILVDATTGRPLAGVVVRPLRSISATLSGDGPKTDANGRFELANQPLGDGQLDIVDGLKTLRAPDSSVTFTLTAGQHLDLGTIKVTDVSTLPTGNTGVSHAQ